ncbi:MAG: hypothetical protein ACM3X6_03195 [Patescibacteria group bacterium]
MENILEIGADGTLVVPAATVAGMGWTPGGKVLLRQADDELNLRSLPMSAASGGAALRETVTALQDKARDF